MAFTSHEIAQLAITAPYEYAEQISAKSFKYRVSREDLGQELSLVCLEKGPYYDAAKGSLQQFLLGHLDKRLRRQLGAHTYAVSLDSDGGESARAFVENMTVPLESDCAEPRSLVANMPSVAKIISVAQFVSGKSTSDLARALRVTPRRVRQILQQLREEESMSKQFELCLEEHP